MGDTSGSRQRGAHDHRLLRKRQQELMHVDPAEGAPRPNAIVDCGWGRLIFAHTFDSAEGVAEALAAERPERRDIALYARDPHVVLAQAPQELFLDPSHTYRLELSTYRPARRQRRGFQIRRLSTLADAEAVNVIYAERHMVPVAPDFFWSRRDGRVMTMFVAEDTESGEILGTVMGIDHVRAFDDPEHGSSLWCLAVAPQAPHAGVGEALVRRLAEHFVARGRAWMDLSVIHDNTQAIGLYEKLGFRRVPVFAIKRKNPFNEKLFTGEAPEADLNPYARLITDEARRRGIAVDVIDADGGFFKLTYGGRSIRCRESLSEFTTAVAMSICDDKRVTSRLVERAGINVPAQLIEDTPEARARFLETHGSVVVKPVRGEQGQGISVGLTNAEEVEKAVERARKFCSEVLLESFFEGHDLRLIVIDYKLVAAATRRPARVIGDGSATVRQLIEAQSRRRAAATGGESQIPLDAETERCVRAAGLTLDDVPEAGHEFNVRRTANLHTGGTIHDVTEETHPVLVDAAVRAARAIEIPVTGIDLMIKSPHEPDYVFIEANERPGLANHEPQPTAERFIDMLFPLSMPTAVRAAQQASP